MRVEKDSSWDTALPAEEHKEECWQPLQDVADFFKVYVPPFSMNVDALFCIAWCPVGPLKENFPDRPFFSLLGKTPLVLWFARFKDFDYTDAMGASQSMSNLAGALPYHELGIGNLLWERGFFMPVLYASSDFGVQLGLSYSMPKQPTTSIELQVTQKSLRANLQRGKQQSFIWARLLGGGRRLARVIGTILPIRLWSIAFPGGGHIRTGISRIECVRIAHVQAGRLALDLSWLPGTTSFFPIGLHLTDMCLELPIFEGVARGSRLPFRHGGMSNTQL